MSKRANLRRLMEKFNKNQVESEEKLTKEDLISFLLVKEKKILRLEIFLDVCIVRNPLHGFLFKGFHGSDGLA